MIVFVSTSLAETTLLAIQAHFHALIRKRAGEFEGINELPLPDIKLLTATEEPGEWFSVPGMYGGFAYWWDQQDEVVKLVTQSWSRVVGGSGQHHEITSDGVKLVGQGFV